MVRASALAWGDPSPSRHLLAAVFEQLHSFIPRPKPRLPSETLPPGSRPDETPLAAHLRYSPSLYLAEHTKCYGQVLVACLFLLSVDPCSASPSSQQINGSLLYTLLGGDQVDRNGLHKTISTVTCLFLDYAYVLVSWNPEDQP